MSSVDLETRCKYCNKQIVLSSNYVTGSGKRVPLERGTGGSLTAHTCRESPFSSVTPRPRAPLDYKESEFLINLARNIVTQVNSRLVDVKLVLTENKQVSKD